MLSQTVEYALRAVAHLASEAPRPLTTEQIAETTRVPKAYLSKVLQALVRGGIVHSQRGVGGGMTLTRSPRAITILDVVNAVDPSRIILGGGITASAGDALFGPLRDRMNDVEWRPDGTPVEIVAAELGDEAGAIGAAKLALECMETGA